MDYSFLASTALFQGIREDEIKHLMSCLSAREVNYRKGEIIYSTDTVVTDIGIVESGSVNIVVNFYWGDSQILGHIPAGDIFAENYAAIPGKELLCDVVAAEDSQILFLNLQRLLTKCRQLCNFHQLLINNLLQISAQKNLNLSSRMLHIGPRGTRDRLLSYLSEQAKLKGSEHFRIPFDRQQLADYLGVERSAMSNELSKMRRDGLIDFHKNEFILKKADLDRY
ncbi:MAG: Crp/Fnr family transcriptional regulator [Eubacteriales bacterium]|nr:Crp/Fnr family transcriptional regulator [Eubacteriales bacterium]